MSPRSRGSGDCLLGDQPNRRRGQALLIQHLQHRLHLTARTDASKRLTICFEEFNLLKMPHINQHAIRLNRRTPRMPRPHHPNPAATILLQHAEQFRLIPRRHTTRRTKSNVVPKLMISGSDISGPPDLINAECGLMTQSGSIYFSLNTIAICTGHGILAAHEFVSQGTTSWNRMELVSYSESSTHRARMFCKRTA